MGSMHSGTTTHSVASVAVVIPIYQPFDALTENEKLSLRQVEKVLSSRDIFLIHPPSVDIRPYCQFFRSVTVNPAVFPARFFGSVWRGHKMGVSYELYNRFSDYDFMLMYQTDAFVFADELDYWCERNLDYIGAPWFLGYHNPSYPLKFVGVGNGGFSLRRISSFKEIARKRAFVQLHLGLHKLYAFLYGNRHLLLRKILGVDLTLKLIHSMKGPEDEFWGMTAPRYFKWFRVADPNEAIRFSFEVKPEDLYKINDGKLPFGCHAWEKYDPDFWRPFIQGS
jgi:hypothetical protein